MSYFIRCSWSTGPLRIPFRLAKKEITMLKSKRIVKGGFGVTRTTGDQLAYVLPPMSLENFAGPSDLFQNHIPWTERNETSSWPVSESFSYPWTNTKRHLGSRAGSDDRLVSTTVAIVEPPDNLSLGRQEDRLLG
jgi:hypothetical protein